MKRALFLLMLVYCWLPFVTADEIPGIKPTALDQYVATPDPNYEYQLEQSEEGEGFTSYMLQMTSQSWLSEEEVDRPLWKHWMIIVKPDEVKTSTGLLFIGGGSNKGEPPKLDNRTRELAEVAVKTNSVVTVLYQVPNQPLHFTGEKVDKYKERGRYEDELIAYCWDQYLRTEDPIWATRLPMVKSAVRAMDTVTLFLGSEEGGNTTVDTFVVAGGSKRGWTTWMTAAVDPRIKAIIPIVIDLLNVVESFKHHWRVYGFWAEAIGDYVEMGLMDHLTSPEFKKLAELVEPYEYRARFVMPKFIINAAGDQFFCPDSSQFYYEDLPGEKQIRYVPNAGHGLDDSDAIESLAAFYYAILYDVPRPDYSWEFLEDGSIRVETEEQPVEVKLWQATNPETRDFRLDTIGKAWSSTKLEAEEEGVYAGNVEEPEEGWTAYFVELTYNMAGKAPLKYTSGVRVVPDTLPYTYPPEK